MASMAFFLWHDTVLQLLWLLTQAVVSSRHTLKPRLHDTTCCQTGLTTGCIV